MLAENCEMVMKVGLMRRNGFVACGTRTLLQRLLGVFKDSSVL